jgi:hypothetical protein
MPTAPRQHEIEREREGERPVVAPAGAPALRHMSPETILALQRTAGNQAVVRRVAVELRQAPPRPKQPSASEQASPENRHLAAEIDSVDALDDKALDKQRADNAKQVAESEGAAHAAAMQKHDAIEYAASRRQLAGPKLDIKQFRHIRTDPSKRRQFLDALVAERAAEEGSFEKAMRGVVIPDPLIVDDLAVIQADADSFKREFRGQARINADRMLRNSHQAIAQLLASYGIPADSAGIAAERILNGGGVAEHAASVIRSMKARSDDPGGANAPGKTHKRAELAQRTAEIRLQQERVREAAKASNLADMHVSVASTPNDGVALEARRTLRSERNKLAGMWIQAEKLHPVLASYRTGGPLEKIELGGLDSADVDVEMKTVLEQVLPKVVSIAQAQAMIKNGTVSPLSLSPVVAMTRANMFVPPGSVRAAVVADMMAEAKEGESSVIMLLSFALALVTMVPTGGASLAVAAGAASAGLAAYTALKELQGYEHGKTLIDTDLDRARALSDEEPSLAGFAMSLIGLGLEGMMLVHAFKTAVQLRRMAMAGEESKRLQGLLDELNKIGKEHNAPELGQQVVNDAKAARGNVLEDAKVRRPPTADPKAAVYNSREEVRLALTKRLRTNLTWGDGSMLSKEFELIDRALAANPGSANAKISKALRHVIKGVRDPELYGEVLADAWALAKRPPGMDINAALEEMATSGGAPVRYIEAKEGILESPAFFAKYAGQEAHFIDLPLAANDHGAMTHLIQDLVVDRALKRAGQNMTSAEFRGLLGQAEGTLGAAEYATKATVTFEVGESEMRTGDYIWRMVYDNTGVKEINRPEAISNQFFLALGIR